MYGTHFTNVVINFYGLRYEFRGGPSGLFFEFLLGFSLRIFVVVFINFCWVCLRIFVVVFMNFYNPIQFFGVQLQDFVVVHFRIFVTQNKKVHTMH